jgi:hypothetical protein
MSDLTLEQEVAYHSRPIEMADILTGVSYAMAFDKNGEAVPDVKRAKRCRRTMERIGGSIGRRPTRGAVAIDPRVRARQKRTQQLMDIIQGQCLRCPLRALTKTCKGAAFP